MRSYVFHARVDLSVYSFIPNIWFNKHFPFDLDLFRKNLFPSSFIKLIAVNVQIRLLFWHYANIIMFFFFSLTEELYYKMYVFFPQPQKCVFKTVGIEKWHRRAERTGKKGIHSSAHGHGTYTQQRSVSQLFLRGNLHFFCLYRVF